MRAKIGRRLCGERGSSLVEYGISMAIVLTLMFGILDFSRMLYTYHWVAFAAGEGSRWASLRGNHCTTYATACPASASDVASFVQGLASSGIPISGSALTCTAPSSANQLNVCTTWPGTSPGTGSGCDTTGGNNTQGCIVQVQVQYNFKFIFPYLVNSGVKTISSTSQIVISQ